MSNASLVLVGTGIKFLSHLTIETQAYIEQSDKILYLVNDPGISQWLKKINSSSESLERFYLNSSLRLESYKKITEHILNNLYSGQNVCVVIYGHPTLFAKPGLDAIKEAKSKGYFTKVLPGISAEDCLFADLQINPGTRGWHSYEATDFLIRPKKIDTSCHLVLWQIGMIGHLRYLKNYTIEKGIKLLVNFLKDFYEMKHRVILYESAQFPHFEPRIKEFPLEELLNIYITPNSTLFIPAVDVSVYDNEMFKLLNISLSDLS